MKTTLFAIALLLSSFGVIAQSMKVVEQPVPSHVRLLGYENDQPVFLVGITNSANDVISISFRFDDGELLYTKRITDSIYLQRFRMNIENLEDVGLNLEIKNTTKGTTETFVIKKNIQYTAQTVIQRIK